MTTGELKGKMIEYKTGLITLTDVMAAVDAYSSASNNGKPLVSGSLPITEDDIYNEAELRYPFHTHPKPHESPYVSSNYGFRYGAKWALQMIGGNDH